jgi:micrococcal nuclease
MTEQHPPAIRRLTQVGLITVLFIGCDVSRLNNRPVTPSPEKAGLDGPPQKAEPSPAANQPTVLEEHMAKVISVWDGDSIRVQREDKTLENVRLDGIDAPEFGQDQSTKAKSALEKLVKGKKVRIQKTGSDADGRILAFVFVEGVAPDVNEQLVRDGWAWHSPRGNADARLADAQRFAKELRLGVWEKDDPVPPWVVRDRKSQRSEFAQAQKEFSLQRRVENQQKAKQAASANAAFASPAIGSSNHWLNTNTGVRHNSRCPHFGSTANGRACGPSEGNPCGNCGG